MNIITRDIETQGEVLTICNQRIAFWHKEKALILSDLHVGKTAHFRKHGIALPSSILVHDLKRLSLMFDFFQPEQIWVVGDLLHAGANSDVDLFCRWRNQYKNIGFHLIRGNHDRIDRRLEAQLCLDSCIVKMNQGPFLFIHDFDPSEPKFQITGHIHPGIVLDSPVRSIKLPCFVVTARQLLLPAFSRFTGLGTGNIPHKGLFYTFTEEGIYLIEK